MNFSWNLKAAWSNRCRWTNLFQIHFILKKERFKNKRLYNNRIQTSCELRKFHKTGCGIQLSTTRTISNICHWISARYTIINFTNYCNTMQKVKFTQSLNTPFYIEVKQKVNAYFTARANNRKANAHMRIKIILIFLIFFASYGIILSNVLSEIQMLFATIIFGLSNVLKILSSTI